MRPGESTAGANGGERRAAVRWHAVCWPHTRSTDWKIFLLSNPAGAR